MPIVTLPPKNNMVTKLLPSTNLTPQGILDVSQAKTKDILAPIPYGRSPGADNLTPDSSLTSQVVL